MRNILVVALSVCFVCSIVVSATAVILKPQRLANKALDRNKNILIAAGLYEKGKTANAEIEGLFDSFTLKVIDLEDKRFLSDLEIQEAGIDVSRYDQRKAAKTAGLSREVTNEEDIASISRRARYSVAYLLEHDGELDRIVLPIHGYGLWSTMYGFLALQGDLQTVAGITFYEQGETAGLGGEVDNPNWKASWIGKQVYGSDGSVALHVIKGKVNRESEAALYQIDGLSGASLTSRGVGNLISYWMGDDGFGPVLQKMQTGAI
jgi:Na+-transporting NADH:ubiquinone oxidoreductase subunit C